MRLNSHITITNFTGRDPEPFKKDFMRLERECFPKSIRETWEEKKALIESAIAVYVIYDLKTNQLIGETYLIDKPDILFAPGMCEDDRNGEAQLWFESKDDEHLYGVLKKCQAEHAAYGYSLAVLPGYRDKALAKRLLMMNTIEARRLGYTKVYSHPREGAALHLQEFFEAKVIEKRENWYGTGNTHYLIERDVQAIHLIPIHPYKQETTYDCGIATSEALLEYESTRNPSVHMLPRERINEISRINITHNVETEAMHEIFKAAGLEVHDVLTEKELYDTIDAGHIAIIGTLDPFVWEGHWTIVYGYGKDSVYTYDVYDGIFGRISHEGLRRMWWSNYEPMVCGFTAYRPDGTNA